MNQKNTQLGKHNPLKASHLEAKAARKKRDMSGIDAFKEWAKTNSPKTYQKIQREEKWAAASEKYWDTMVDDPSSIALWSELSALFDAENQKGLSVELALLGVEAGVTKRELRNAYRRKARKLHPDVGGDAEAFKQMHAAYRALLKVAHD